MMRRARESIAAAQTEVQTGLPNNAVADAYYAMFHATRAVLASLGQGYSSHSAVLGAFGREFAKTAVLPPEMHRQLIDAFDKRLKATYDYRFEATSEQAEQLIRQAGEFVDRVEAYLEEG
jgi:uncharacterized protein (UPF0332 family)